MTSHEAQRNQTSAPRRAEPDDRTPVSVSSNGEVVSYYGDVSWDLTPFHSRHLSIRFVARNADAAPAAQINCQIFKRIVYFWLHERLRPISATTVCARHSALKHLVAVCDHHRVVLTDVSRYPALLREVSERIPASTFGTLINILRELGVASRRLGFSVADERALSRLRALRTEYQSNQSPYIPERIYSHIIERCQQLVADYLRNRNAFERLYRAELTRHLVPGECVRAPSHEKLLSTLTPIMESWLGRTARSREASYTHPRSLTKFLTAVRFAGHVLIIAFSGMRNLEALALTTSCVQVDSDAVLGDVYMLQGRTTKTIRDDKAVWITSRQVLPAIEAMSSVAHLRARAARDSGRSMLRQPAILLSLRTTDPWIRIQRGDLTLPARTSFAEWALRCPLLFDRDALKIRRHDLEVARSITPDLDLSSFYEGAEWHLTYHQLRRTLTCNAAASGLVSIPSLQYQLKHQHRAMTEYYGRRHSQLNLSESIREDYAQAVLSSILRSVRLLPKDDLVSPLGPRLTSKLLEFAAIKDLEALKGLASSGQISLRENALGLCLHKGFCEFGGYENLSRCVSCPEALFRRSRRPWALRRHKELDDEITAALAAGDHLYAESLRSQMQSLERYLEIVQEPI